MIIVMFLLQETEVHLGHRDVLVLKARKLLVVAEGCQDHEDVKVIQDFRVLQAHLDLKEMVAVLASLELQVKHREYYMA